MDSQLIEQNRSLTTIKSEADLPPHISFEKYKELRTHPAIEKTKDRMLITLLWETAGRISDVLKFKWDNFDGLNSDIPLLRFVIQKTDTPIQIPLSRDIATELRQWKGDVKPENDKVFLFPGERQGYHETRQNIQKKMKRWGALIELPGLHAHMFRHGLVVYLFLTCGLHYKIVAARTGYKNPMMIVNTYSVVTVPMQREALRGIPLR